MKCKLSLPLAFLFVILATLLPVTARAAIFNILDGDVAGLIAAIDAANLNPDADVINLAKNGTYTLTAPFDSVDFAGLPRITSQITINGNGATIQRSLDAGIPDFRILVTFHADLTLDGVTIRGGRAPSEGGGLFNNNSKLLLKNSTVTENSGNGGGGGIMNYGATLIVENTTISHNTDLGGYGGGGILNYSATATIINSTLFENRADGQPESWGHGDALAEVFSSEGSVTLKNSILASPTRGLGYDCYSGYGPNGLFMQTSLGHNIIGDASGALTFTGPGDLNSTDPLLGPLADNGGPTWTHMPLPGSPAIDAVPRADCTDANGVRIATDQRGVIRPQGSTCACDIGSVEREQVVSFNIPDGDVCGLIGAINAANINSGADTINLAPGGTYTLTALDNITEGENGLPAITSQITINGNGATIQRDPGAPSFRIFYVAGPNAGDLTLNRVTIKGGDSNYGYSGAGIFIIGGTVTMTKSTVANNYGLAGGGICNVNGSLAISSSTIRDNSTFYYGGGIYNLGSSAILTMTDSTVRDNRTGGYRGGGIVNVVGTVTLANSTVSGNISTGQGAGGIWNWIGGMLTLINSAVSGNTGNGYSGGILNDGSTLTLVNCTVSGNRDVNAGGLVAGGFGNGSGTVTMKNTIVANNTVNANNSPSDCAGAITSLGYNIVGDTSVTLTGPGDLNNINPMLEPLADNGGPTWTHTPLPGSPAIDAVPLANLTDASGNPITTDQRGVARPQGAFGDIGSVELDCQPVITTQPQSVTLDGCMPDLPPTVTFTVDASGPSLRYQWESSSDGVTFTTVQTTNFPSYTIYVGPDSQHLWLHVKVSNGCGQVVSSVVEYTFIPASTPLALLAVQVDCAHQTICLTYNKAVLGSSALDPNYYSLHHSLDPDALNPLIIVSAAFGPGQNIVCLTIDPSTPLTGSDILDLYVEDLCGVGSSFSTPVTFAPVPNAATLPTVTGQCSAAIASAPTATDNCTGTTVTGTTTDPLTYTSQGTFTVSWTYTDGLGNRSSQTQTVIVQDTTPPVPNAATLPTVTGQCSATIASAPTATDNCAGTVTGTTTDPLIYTSQGTFTITWTYNDGNGNNSSQTQTVTVKDSTPPVPNAATLPTVTGQCSATVASAPTATDNCAGTVAGTTTDPLTYPSQGTFTITWTYNDGNGNNSSQTQTVIVKDTMPPVITGCPANITVQTGPGRTTCDQVATWTPPTASDNCTLASLTSTRSPGATFPVGTTTVTYTATDGAIPPNTTLCSFNVTVADTTPPVLNCNVTTSLLWPANNALRNVGLSFTATDACSPPVTTHVSVYSDEPNAPINPDATYVGTSLRLRAQRKIVGANANGRVYLIVVTATDAVGNRTFCCKTVVVPRLNNAVWVANVNAQAATAMATCTATGSLSTPYVIRP